MLKKIRQVEQVFREMEKRTTLLNKRTKVNCPAGCILCCLKPDLEASVLEFLPLAKYLIENNLEEEVIQKIEAGQTLCISLRTERQGDLLPGCTYYDKRGAICRLFGSAVIQDRKSARQILYACKTLKDENADRWQAVSEIIKNQEDVPMVADYYYRLYTIDHHLANDYNPINQSILKAINIVSLHLAHQ